MLCLVVCINGNKICSLGLSRINTRCITLLWLGDEDGEQTSFLNIGGMDHDNHHVFWPASQLQFGDEVTIRMAECDAIDFPTERKSSAEMDEWARNLRPAQHDGYREKSRNDVRIVGKDPIRGERESSRGGQVLAFIILLNGNKICSVELADDNRDVTISWPDLGPGEPTVRFMVTGMDEEDHLNWSVPHLTIGDEVLIKFTDTSATDPPNSRRRYAES